MRYAEKKAFLNNFIIAMMLSQLLGVVGETFFYIVQENQYGQKNFLEPVFNELGIFQLSMTSFFVCLILIGNGLVITFRFLEPNLAYKPAGMNILFSVPIATAIVYSLYEFNQSINPPYPDNHFIDALMGWLACLLCLYLLAWVKKTASKVKKS